MNRRLAFAFVVLGVAMTAAAAVFHRTSDAPPSSPTSPFVVPPLSITAPVYAESLWSRVELATREGRVIDAIDAFDRLTRLEPRHVAPWSFAAYTVAIEIAPFEPITALRLSWYRRAIEWLDRGIVATRGDRSLRELKVRILQGALADDLIIRTELSRLWGKDTAETAADVTREILRESPNDVDATLVLVQCEEAVAVQRLRAGAEGPARDALARAIAVLDTIVGKTDDDHRRRVRAALDGWHGILAAIESPSSGSRSGAEYHARLFAEDSADETALATFERRMGAEFENLVMERVLRAAAAFDHDRARRFVPWLSAAFTERLGGPRGGLLLEEWIERDRSLRNEALAAATSDDLNLQRWRGDFMRIDRQIGGAWPDRVKTAWRRLESSRPGLREN